MIQITKINFFLNIKNILKYELRKITFYGKYGQQCYITFVSLMIIFLVYIFKNINISKL